MIKEMSLADITYLSHKMRQKDVESVIAFSRSSSLDLWAADRFRHAFAAYTLIDKDGIPVVCSGFDELHPGVLNAWLVATPDICRHWKEAWVGIKRAIKAADNRYHRIEAHCLTDYPEAERFLRKLGFEFECLKRRAGVGGQNALYFAKVREEP